VNLFGAPTHVFKKLEDTWLESLNAWLESKNTRQVSLMSERALGNLAKHRKVQYDWEEARLTSTRGLLTISGTMATMYYGLRIKGTGGPTMSRPTWS
jgi:hypothetical protein